MRAGSLAPATDPSPGGLVRLRGNPQRIGILERIVELNGRVYAKVRFPDGSPQVPLDQIEALPPARKDPLDFLAEGSLDDPRRLRQLLAHVRLTGRLADMVYSLEATNTDFHAHQFKPVLKMLASPTGALLVADEVGLGKTIEAGLVWTELRARHDLRRMLVLCPKVLTEKWKTELSTKFDLDARIYGAAELLELLDDETARDRGFVAICSLQGARPPRGWRDLADGEGRAAARLARLLDERAADEPVFDLAVFDEAHHLRNPGTQSNALGRLIRDVSAHLLFLSATPIHLGNRDLQSLLSLVDPDTFRDETTLGEIIDANAGLIAAREATLRGDPPQAVLAALDDAAESALLSRSAQLRAIRDDVEALADQWTEAARARIAGRLDEANLLSNVVNRTRRRDVEELRVQRQVRVHRAEFTSEERAVYDAISEEVRLHALQGNMPPAFLLAGPQRMLASSIPAALAHWRANLADPEFEDDAGDDENDATAEVAKALGPLVARLTARAAALPHPRTLEAQDTKYRQLIGVLRAHLAENPDEKAILFSSFRPTLAYLRRRLEADGIACATLHGGVTDGRMELIDGFRGSPTQRVLLSSEVGSEGVDLQFARIVVNYDLPWNPMRIEQRIGRVDRLGQAATSVAVVNLLHRLTIDEVIYDRLFTRLKVCERALGGFEEVLGAEILRLTPEILAGRLSLEEIARQLDLTAVALENRRLQEEQLEKDAAALVAYGDRILQHILKARDQHLWLGGDELAAYLADGLEATYPGSRLRKVPDGQLHELRLSAEARREFRDWLDRRKSVEGRALLREDDPKRCRIGRAPSREDRARRIEAIPQTHPLVRFVAERIAEAPEGALRPAVAARLSRSALPDGVAPAPGRYVVLAQLWRFDGVTPLERIAYAGLPVDAEGVLDPGVAETLMLAAGAAGGLWPAAVETLDLPALATRCEIALAADLEHRFEEARRARAAELNDRAAIQRQTVERRLAERRASLGERIERQRARFNFGGRDAEKGRKAVDLFSAQLRREEERAADRLKKIEENRRLQAEATQFAVAVVEVVL